MRTLAPWRLAAGRWSWAVRPKWPAGWAVSWATSPRPGRDDRHRYSNRRRRRHRRTRPDRRPTFEWPLCDGWAAGPPVGTCRSRCAGAGRWRRARRAGAPTGRCSRLFSWTRISGGLAHAPGPATCSSRTCS